MSLRLRDFLQYDNIVIQCHDNPDADALASGFALLRYFEKAGKEAGFVYGGRNAVCKSNLILMIANLGIRVNHVEELKKPDLLITVDCQYGESNVTRFEAEKIAVIDHHQVSGDLPELSDVRSNYGSCSTVLYELLQQEDFDINSDENLATALYYGLMTDTGGFTEISHPSDRDLRDFVHPRNADITLFRNSNLSREELVIAGDALKHAHYFEERAYAIVEAKPCDPNILGIISDMLLEVDTVDACLVYSMMPFGIKISVRSCVREVKASELAAFITKGYGGGGGHLVKAGGLLKKDLLEAAGIGYDSDSVRHFLFERMRDYYENTEILYAGERIEDVSKLTHYTKKEVRVGYVECEKLAPYGTRIMIRTLEGDVDVEVREDLVILIGIEGEIYPTNRQKFNEGYRELPKEEYVCPVEYAPRVTDIATGNRMSLLPFAKPCVAAGGAGIYAKELDHRVKVFTVWDPDKYYLGVPGDYLAVRVDDPSDIYVIAREIFLKTYMKG
ncbi:MAG: DHH family phosphoesterase [Lachnospiraceae bacterium]|nr:DHH family phosphoesterase [Lachnospiraceae bacterium]